MSTSKNRRMMDDCSCTCATRCVPQETEIKNVRLSAAYVPFQYYCSVFTPLEALIHGTAFPELVWPYVPFDKKRCYDKR